MSANESYLEAELNRQYHADIEQEKIEVGAKERLANMTPPEADEFFQGYEMTFTGFEMDRMLRNLKDACHGKQYAIDAILTCVSEFEKRCLAECETIERDLLDNRP
jgi:hypothetical protein